MNRRAFFVAIVLLAAAGGRHLVLHAKPMSVPNANLMTFPQAIDGWRSLGDVPFDGDVESLLGADQYLNRQYVAPDQFAAGLYVGYYRIQRQGAAIHSPLNCLPGAGWQPVSTARVPLGHGSPDLVNRVVVQKGETRQAVFYWYQSRGRIVASEYWSKLHLVVDSVTTRRSDTALVRVIAPLPRGGNDQIVFDRAQAFAALAASSVRTTLFP
jgi:EpsI family protein